MCVVSNSIQNKVLGTVSILVVVLLENLIYTSRYSAASVIDTSSKYKFLWKLPLDDLEVVKGICIFISLAFNITWFTLMCGTEDHVNGESLLQVQAKLLTKKTSRKPSAVWMKISAPSDRSANSQRPSASLIRWFYILIDV